jgi:hypothetical protein
MALPGFARSMAHAQQFLAFGFGQRTQRLGNRM